MARRPVLQADPVSGRPGLGLWIPLGILILASPLIAYVGFRVWCGIVGGGGLYSIPANSMAPALRGGDRIHALPAVDADIPAIGSVIVYRRPDGVEFVKRVLAHPGQRIAFVNGRPVIDGVAATWKRDGIYVFRESANAPPYCQDRPSHESAHCVAPLFLETLANGVSQHVIELGETSIDEFPEITVPEGHVFVAGDHRDNSVDSRMPWHGTVPVETITGVAWHYLLPLRSRRRYRTSATSVLQSNEFIPHRLGSSDHRSGPFLCRPRPAGTGADASVRRDRHASRQPAAGVPGRPGPGAGGRPDADGAVPRPARGRAWRRASTRWSGASRWRRSRARSTLAGL